MSVRRAMVVGAILILAGCGGGAPSGVAMPRYPLQDVTSPGPGAPASPAPSTSPSVIVPSYPVGGNCFINPSPLPVLVSPANGATGVVTNSGTLTLTLGFYEAPRYWNVDIDSAALSFQAVGTPAPSGEQLYSTTISGLAADTTYSVSTYGAVYVPPPTTTVCTGSIPLIPLGSFTTR